MIGRKKPPRPTCGRELRSAAPRDAHDLRILLTLDGERVVNAIPDIGYLHSGFEKLGESLDYNQYVTITDRMNYISPMTNNVAWHMAVEKLLGIEITPRCSYIRTIICELMRISDHLLCLGAVGLDFGRP